jgi:predicted NBD/HSP70 family sugar kinase
VNPDEVLSLVLERAPISRSDIARETRLSKAAVTALVQDFAALGIVEDNIPTVSRGGRKATGIRLDLQRFFMIAVRVNRLQATFRLFDGAGREIDTVEAAIDPDITVETLLELLGATIGRLVSLREGHVFLGIAISTLGWLHEHQGEIRLHTDGFPELGKCDIRAEVQAMFPSVPVLLEHDAKTSALAEYRDQVSRTGVKPACLLNIVGGIGFGGGIIIDGKVFRGASGVAGEVGHLGINFNSAIHTRDAGGAGFNGLFEDYASPRALRQHVTSRLLDFPGSELTEESTPEEIYRAFEAGDPLAVWAVDRMCRLTAYGLAGLVFVLNPDVIVLGDNFPKSGAVLNRTKGHLAGYLPEVLMERLRLEVSARGRSGVLYGAYLLLIQWYLSHDRLYQAIRSAKEAER